MVPFAAIFGWLTAGELLYLTWLLVEPGSGPTPQLGVSWPVVALSVLAVWVGAGALLVFLGRARGWLVQATGSVFPLIGLFGIVVLFRSLGAGRETWWAVLMTIGPIGSLILATQRPVRDWTSR